ncbi:(R)-citramalate synthase [Magnetococcus marinus MC-1]|uniref:Citramalate synthase n=1 Tax=Magnetococcus marinus (strain ATCC BAA-1437 / JCM 17883 / MC-1) TaxID=156889 RepID=A0L692_MAGMM|nr:citramalate synthase [Magnetococcus marinus]ABK43485.1 (R)-citramalate synthase [Magnetococcus marinus MC-1]
MSAQAHPPVVLYDTTLRDGSQSEDVLFSAEDKLRIAKRLDALGLDYIEGGWPGANPKDDDFFRQAKQLKLQKSRITAFGSTRRAGSKVEEDQVIKGLLGSGAQVITVFGKSWDLHVSRALGIPLAQNLELIFDTIRYLKRHVDEVFYDAEHFFDGYRRNPEYARQTLQAAYEGGADALVLCDTNGGTMVEDLRRMIGEVTDLGAPLGIHCHNDCELAVANSLAAVEAGVTHIQGTINGIGERCGNANLISIIPNLKFKMQRSLTLDDEDLTQLTAVSRFVNEMANRPTQKNQPYVGVSAFAHKGGIHVSAVLKDASTYEHISPDLVGNQQRVLVSEQAGRSNLIYKLEELGIEGVDAKDPRLTELLLDVKELEHQGYQFDGADASFQLRVWKALGELPNYFELLGFRVIDERRVRKDGQHPMGAEATVKMRVAGESVHLVAEGAGPVDALHKALSKALRRDYPMVTELKLEDFKVRILGNRKGTEATVRVLIEWYDGRCRWGTVGVSDHIIAASYDAMVEAVKYKLFKDKVKPV